MRDPPPPPPHLRFRRPLSRSWPRNCCWEEERAQLLPGNCSRGGDVLFSLSGSSFLASCCCCCCCCNGGRILVGELPGSVLLLTCWLIPSGNSRCCCCCCSSWWPGSIAGCWPQGSVASAIPLAGNDCATYFRLVRACAAQSSDLPATAAAAGAISLSLLAAWEDPSQEGPPNLTFLPRRDIEPSESCFDRSSCASLRWAFLVTREDEGDPVLLDGRRERSGG